MPKCHRVADDLQRALTGRHGEDCPARPTYDHKGRLMPAPECRGCEPCTDGHCVSCGWRHSETLNCPTCVGEAREAINAIERLAVRAWGEALVKGANSTAAMLVGPVADVDRWMRRHRLVVNAAVAGQEKPLTAWTEDNRDEQHPLWVLGTWDMQVTEHLEHERTQRVTITRAADYLRANLTELADDGDFALAFSDLRRDVLACQVYLEEVLHDGEREVRGIHCWAPGCDRRPDLLLVRDEVGTDDRWTCEACGSWWDDADYQRVVKASHVGSADRLNTDDMSARTRVPVSTIRRWASTTTTYRDRGDGTKEKTTHPPRLRSCGRGPDGRKVYRVNDVLALRDGLRDVS